MISLEPNGETSHHIPILKKPIVDFLIEGLLALPSDSLPGIVLDCTLGGGGHTSSLLECMRKHSELKKHCVVGIDRDPEAVKRNQHKFSNEVGQSEIEIHHLSFSDALQAVNGRPIYGLLADLGISSDQIDSENRGFSFRYPAPLDMRMNNSDGETLYEWLMHASERELSDVLWEYGEERQSRQIARRLMNLRSRNELPKTSLELAEAIESVFPPKDRYRGHHVATRSFQALRILINDELGELKTLIEKVFPAVAPQGRLAILSFHSLEDRLIKEAFRTREMYTLPHKKPIEADEAETTVNPRSRSAKLRLAIRN